MSLFLSFCNNEVLPPVKQLGRNPLSKHSFSCNLTFSCKRIKFFNQNSWTKSWAWQLSIWHPTKYLFQTSCGNIYLLLFFNINFTSQVLQPLCNLLMIYNLTPYVSLRLFRFFSQRLIIITSLFCLILLPIKLPLIIFKQSVLSIAI